MRTRILRPVAAVAAALALMAGGAAGWAVSGAGDLTGDLTGHGDARRISGDQTAAVKKALQAGPARNVILLIGDGMGDSEITVARNYALGAAGRFAGIDALPLTGQYTTYALDKADGLPDYVTDSAASGSAWATGTKTYNGAISVDVDGVPQRSILEIARANGLRTGNVSTAEIQDATPAVLGAHVTSRSCYGPVATSTTCPTNALENGGLGSISEQLIATRADVTLGGGAKAFGEKAKAGPWAGKTLLEQAKARGYQVVTDEAGLDAVSSADQQEPVLGLFGSGNLPVRWQGPLATHTGGAEPAVRCTENPAYGTAPKLAELTTTAIGLLDDAGARKGFFLQVEGASIDKQDHAANPCGQIGETVDLDEAVQAALAFAAKDKHTLVVVTADHAHSSQIVYTGTTTPGLTRTLTTADGKPMTVAYGTAEEGGSQAHTGSQLRVAGFGPGAANVVGLTDQTDLFFTVRDALRLDPAAPTPGAPQIRSVNLSDDAVLRGKQTVRVKLAGEPKQTVFTLIQDDEVVATSRRTGTSPSITLDTRRYDNGPAVIQIVVTGHDGLTTSRSIPVTIANR
jgi:alkaline phosphatase